MNQEAAQILEHQVLAAATWNGALALRYVTKHHSEEFAQWLCELGDNPQDSSLDENLGACAQILARFALEQETAELAGLERLMDE